MLNQITINMANQMKELPLAINEEFAKKFRKQKEKPELDILKLKFGEDKLDDESESSSSESEDEDAREVTAENEKDFLAVLSMIKNKDPKIYEEGSSFYHDEGRSSSEEERNKSVKKVKPMFLKDYERKQLLERGSMAFISDDEGDEENAESKTGRRSPTYVEEQKLIKESFHTVFEENDTENGGDFLKLREKTSEENVQEERGYVEWLKGDGDKVKTKPSSQREALRHYWMNPHLDEDEQFLRDYILNRNYLEKDSKRIPTYDEIVEDDQEDEEEIEKQHEFERKFNFRFEEPDAEFIKTYPRTIQGSVRKVDERRTEKRKQRKSRKEKEKEEKREELKRLKKLKRKEIIEKLEKLKEITGNPTVGFKEEDIEGDFDPEKYDETMKNVFGEQFYAEDDEGKPVFEDDLVDEEENWDESEGSYDGNMDMDQQEDYYYEPHVDDPGFNMDADYEENVKNQNMGENSRKRRLKFSFALSKKKPVFDPDEKTFEEYFDEYYKLDYEDMIGDTPCRFKYRQVVPNNFGLTTEEILACSDKELNQWVSVRKMSQYRANKEEVKELRKFRRRGRNVELKNRILTSLLEKESAQDVRKQRKSGHKKAGDNLPFAKKGVKEKTSEKEAVQADGEKEETTSIGTDTNRNRSIAETEMKVHKIAQNDRNSGLKGETESDKGKMKIRKRKRLTFKEMKEMAMKKRVQKQFRGAKKEQLNRLSVGRLASYGVQKKKRKNKKVS